MSKNTSLKISLTLSKQISDINILNKYFQKGIGAKCDIPRASFFFYLQLRLISKASGVPLQSPLTSRSQPLRLGC